MIPVDIAALAGAVAATGALAGFRVRGRVTARRHQMEAEHQSYLTWMRDLVAFMDAPKGYAGGLANVVMSTSDGNGAVANVTTVADGPTNADAIVATDAHATAHLSSVATHVRSA